MFVQGRRRARCGRCAAVDIYVGLETIDPVADGEAMKFRHEIHGGERRENLGTFRLRRHRLRSGAPRQTALRGAASGIVVFNSHHQNVTQITRLLEQADMAGMKQAECTGSGNYPLAFALPFTAQFDQSFRKNDLSHSDTRPRYQSIRRRQFDFIK